MVALPLPLISAPGRRVQASGGRLINTIVEKLSDTAGAKFIYWRAPGLVGFGTAASGTFRGGIQVGNIAYCVFGTRVYSFTSAGGVGALLPGTLPGTTPVFIARDNATTPNIVVVAPGDGAFVIASGSVSAYPDANVLQPNSVVFHKGIFNFTYGDGKVRNSNVNSTTINTLSVASAESKPDTLYRSIPLDNGQIALAGSSTIEFWGGQNDTGYFFNYIATAPRGICGAYGICGNEDGWGFGIYLIGDAPGVYSLNGYSVTKVSPNEVDQLIEKAPDKSVLRISCYVIEGHPYVCVQSPTWCWEYDVSLQAWHERQSYLVTYWRAMLPFKAFDRWLIGDSKTSRLLQVSAAAQDEIGDPLRMRIETGPLGDFPNPVIVNGIELSGTKGVGIATGADPTQTDPSIEISMSRDGGQTFGLPRLRKVGHQSVTNTRVRAHSFGHCEPQGMRFRFDMSDNVPFGLMAADVDVESLR